MRIAYFIAVYNAPDQLAVLMKAIWRPQDLFIIHIDARTPATLADRLRAACPAADNVILMPSIPVIWGGGGLIKAERSAMRIALDHEVRWDYFANLSGSDLPIRPAEDIDAVLSADPHRNFVKAKAVRDLPAAERRHIRRRLRWYCFESDGRIRRLPIPRLLPSGVDWDWYGPTWHHLTRAFCEWICTDPVVDTILESLWNTKIPDEAWIQILLMNSRFKDTCAPDNRRFILWQEGKASPRVLTLSDMPRLKASDAFFARKFDLRADPAMAAAALQRAGNPGGALELVPTVEASLQH